MTFISNYLFPSLLAVYGAIFQQNRRYSIITSAKRQLGNVKKCVAGMAYRDCGPFPMYEISFSGSDGAEDAALGSRPWPGSGTGAPLPSPHPPYKGPRGLSLLFAAFARSSKLRNIFRKTCCCRLLGNNFLSSLWVLVMRKICKKTGFLFFSENTLRQKTPTSSHKATR